MAEGRKGCSNYFTRKRAKKPPAPEFVEMSDSSSESVEEVPSTSSPSVYEAAPQLQLKPTGSTSKPETVMECPVCLQQCIHPARLPCGHTFCFLCLKGIAQQSGRCAMCRQEISPDYLDRPDLLQVSSAVLDEKEAETFEGGYQWFYEGRNGWWQFEERLSHDLEEARSHGEDKLETLICGTLYVLDLQALVQYNKNNPSRKRKIRRDLISNVVVKGIAGIR